MRTVHLDGCVEVEAAYYSTPPGWIGQRVQVQWTDLHVRVLNPKTGQLLREHVRASRGHHRIVEGIKKGDSLTSRGCCAVTLTGAYNWRNRFGTLGDWEDVPLKGREVVLCFDADARMNMNVARAMVPWGAGATRNVRTRCAT